MCVWGVGRGGRKEGCISLMYCGSRAVEGSYMLRYIASPVLHSSLHLSFGPSSFPPPPLPLPPFCHPSQARAFFFSPLLSGDGIYDIVSGNEVSLARACGFEETGVFDPKDLGIEGCNCHSVSF